MSQGNGGRTGHGYRQLKAIVLHRDGPTCALCAKTCATTGNPRSPDYATLDHITPLSHARNPTERARLLLDPDNARIACLSCNSRRGNTVTTTNPLPGW